MLILTAALFTFINFASFRSGLEDGLQGIKVFETQRAEVEKRFKGSRNEEDGYVKYLTDEFFIKVIYSTEPCSAPGTVSGGFKVPKNTVLEYNLRPREDLLLKDLDYQPSLYSRYEDGHVIGFINYYNKRDEIRITTFMTGHQKIEKVRSISFGRTADQASAFACK